MNNNVLKFQHHQPSYLRISQTTLPRHPTSLLHLFPKLSFRPSSFSLSKTSWSFKFSSLSNVEQPVYFDDEEERGGPSNESVVEFEDLVQNGVVYRETLRLVECSMFAAVTGLVYFLSNSLAIENYFGCFFSLPIVISSMRWGVACGRKQLVCGDSFVIVCLVWPGKGHKLSGRNNTSKSSMEAPILGVSLRTEYLVLLWVLYGGNLVVFALKSGADWTVSIPLCTLVARAIGLVGYVLTTSFLIRENILALITINIHASLSYIFAAVGINLIPSMNFIYTLFGILVLLNSASFVFLLHLLYSLFLTRMGMKTSLRLPRWFKKAI
ncbi:Outer membrane usher papC [Gossypium arboreum]|uniref:Outer membrane usher papC n=1 Tax=Gossypium arboreum TaxID=29729 RepID=A0A0B0P5T2_GOSAR|nr:Outer membrane usher papC [Gossypium arboreum]